MATTGGSARGGFSSRLGFVAAAAGSAVGLGNIWGFPYEAGENGGGAFLFVYLICTLVVGFPIMTAEIALGRKAQSDPYGAYLQEGGRSWSYAGLFGVLCGIMILSFYNVVAGWAFGYFLQIAFGGLLSEPDYAAYFGRYTTNVSDNLIFSLVFMIITAFVVARGIKGGVEKASKILMPMLFVILLGLIVYSLTLEGASAGLQFYLLPDVSKITGQTLYSAMGQAFFSLSLGMGALITYGSYISKKDNIVTSAAIVTVADLSVAFLAGLLIFPLVYSQGQDPAQGPGLVFVILPGVFESMGPIMGRVIGGGFFLLLCFAALTSTISLLEVPVTFLVDQRKRARKTIVWVLAGLVFVLGLPSMLSQGAVDAFTNFIYYEGGSRDFLTFVDDVFNKVGLPFGGLILSLFVATRWRKHLKAETEQGAPESFKNSLVQNYITIMLTVVCPVVLGAILLVTLTRKIFNYDLLEALF